MKKFNQAEENEMRSIRISDDLVLQLHPEPNILKTSVNWTDFETDDPGITLIEVFAFLAENLISEARSGTFQSRLIELRPSLLKLHEKVRILEELLSRLLAEQSEK